MRLLRNLVALAAGTIGAALVLAIVFLVLGWNRLHQRRPGPAPPLRVAADPSLIPRGEHLAAIACAGCHGPDGRLPLAGGDDDLLAPPGGPVLGHLRAPNLTPGGALARYDDGQLARAIREGVRADGTPLLAMPASRFHALSDLDVAALVAYLRHQPAIAGGPPKRHVALLGWLLIGLRLLEPDVQIAVDRAVPDTAPAMTARYGAYLSRLTGCPTCHGPDLRGGRPLTLAPRGPDLVRLAAAHGLEPFDAALRRGVSERDGHALDPRRMPYRVYAGFSDTDVGALYAHLQALGNRH